LSRSKKPTQSDLRILTGQSAFRPTKLALGQFVHRGGTALGAAAVTTASLTGLFEELSLTEFLLDTGMLNQLTKSPDGILN